MVKKCDCGRELFHYDIDNFRLCDDVVVRDNAVVICPVCFRNYDIKYFLKEGLYAI